jgi:hypothetical protein
MKPAGRRCKIRDEPALRLVQRGELDPVLALSLVVWPPRGELEDESVPLEHRAWDESVKLEARRLHAEGLGCPEIAERLAVRFPTVKSWLWDTAEWRRASRQARRLAHLQEETGRLF